MLWESGWRGVFQCGEETEGCLWQDASLSEGQADLEGGWLVLEGQGQAF